MAVEREGPCRGGGHRPVVSRKLSTAALPALGLENHQLLVTCFQAAN